MSHVSTLFLIELNKILAFFRIFGFVDSYGSVGLITKIRFLVILSSLFYMIYNILFVEIRRNYNPAGYFIHAVYHSLNSISAIVSLITSAIYRKKLTLLLNKIKHIDEDFSNLLSTHANHSYLLKTLIIRNIFFIFIFCGICFIIVYEGFVTRPNLRAFLIFYFVPFIIYGISHLRLCFFILLVAFYARVLEYTLEKSKDVIDNNKWTIYHLKIVSRIYRLLWESSQLINEIFSGYITVAFGNTMSGIIYRGYLYCDEMISRGTFNFRVSLGIIQCILLSSYVILVSECFIKIVRRKSDVVFDI